MLLVVQPSSVPRVLNWGCSVGKGQHLQSECHVCSQETAFCVRRGACCSAVALSSVPPYCGTIRPCVLHQEKDEAGSQCAMLQQPDCSYRCNLTLPCLQEVLHVLLGKCARQSSRPHGRQQLAPPCLRISLRIRAASSDTSPPPGCSRLPSSACSGPAAAEYMERPPPRLSGAACPSAAWSTWSAAAA